MNRLTITIAKIDHDKAAFEARLFVKAGDTPLIDVKCGRRYGEDSDIARLFTRFLLDNDATASALENSIELDSNDYEADPIRALMDGVIGKSRCHAIRGVESSFVGCATFCR